MKIWVDDLLLPPEGYTWFRYVDEVIAFIEAREWRIKTIINYGTTMTEERIEDLKIDLIDLDDLAGSAVVNGGEYIRILEWLESTGRNYPIRLHGEAPGGSDEMRAIIARNGWKEVE